MIKQLLQEGFILKSKGYYKHAIESFYKALEYDSKSSELLLEIADCYYLMRDDESALSYIEQILDQDSTHIESLKLLKKIFIGKGAWEQAVKTAENIYIISSATSDLIEILRLLNKQNKYIEVLNFKTDKESASVFYEKSYAGLFSNNLDLAEEYIEKAISLEPENLKFLLLKGKILFKQGREDDCYNLINTIEIDRNNADLLNYVGLVEQLQGNYKKAIEYFKTSIALEPANHEYFYNCASTYFKMGEISIAKKYYNIAISMNPENPSYHLALANLYFSEKQYRRALEELDFDFYEANLLKALILYESGYMALAKKGFDMLKAERPDDFVVEEYLNKIKDKLNI